MLARYCPVFQVYWKRRAELRRCQLSRRPLVKFKHVSADNLTKIGRTITSYVFQQLLLALIVLQTYPTIPSRRYASLKEKTSSDVK